MNTPPRLVVAALIAAGISVGTAGCEEQSAPPGNGGGSGSGSNPQTPTTTSATAGNPDPSGVAGGVSHQPKSLLGRSADTARKTRQGVEDRQSEALSAANEINGEGQALEFNGVKFIAPASWQKKPASGMRAAELKAQAPDTDGPDGECTVVVFTFKPGEGGNTQMNVDRWVAQFKSDGGEPPEPEVGRRQISGLPVTTVALEGTYTEMTPNGAASTARRNWGFRAALVESSRGNIILRMTGPRDAVNALQSQWSGMIDGMTR
jgi:hypothetical protein